MQTAEGALDETSNILVRMKDLATQAADGSSTDADRTAMQAEYDSLTNELTNIFGNTKFGGTSLFNSTDGKLIASITFQIGADMSETMDADFTGELTAASGSILTAAAGFDSTGATPITALGAVITTDTAANTAIGNLTTAIDDVATLRSKLGAVSNRLDHVYNNLSNISTNTKTATGRIMDVDFASESASMTSSQMLLQAGTAMLKQSNSQSSLVLSLLQ
eukprot:gene28688-35590_t